MLQQFGHYLQIQLFFMEHKKTVLKKHCFACPKNRTENTLNKTSIAIIFLSHLPLRASGNVAIIKL